MTIEILPSSAPDVVLLRIEGKAEHEDVLRVIDLLEDLLFRNEKTHVLVEAIDFSGFEPQHVPEYLRRGLPLLGKLKRFGRIAVVSDQAWLRTLARIESALLPNISYETFDLSERERALAWVEGREPRPHGAGLQIIETSRPDVLAFEIDGKLSEDELETIVERFEPEESRPAPKRVIGKIIRLGGAEMKGLFDDDFVKMKLHAFSNVERYALIGGPAWLAGWVTFIDALTKGEIRHFSLEDEAAAWDWIGTRPHKDSRAPDRGVHA
ncbi:STAS/SEC14 domain-containing protein [Chelativorans sp. Marseille-P2723]|uniref:STAS/SEC14 domain-containing protein n=1 Tax=Chelativorans sp. Marseille-P2723 TaxID=2709133 RepID=UPI00156FBAA4|nr:STAS/SEC14 domain-containing protein [Chelativorans sp. Marseille-P2723]